jgi:hypothetical protein
VSPVTGALQPALHIKQAGTSGGAASIRIDDPNPDIEFVESDQVAPAGKYEIAVQSDTLQINGRNAGNSGFETIAVFRRIGADGNIGLRTRDQFGAGDTGGRASHQGRNQPESV